MAKFVVMDIKNRLIAVAPHAIRRFCQRWQDYKPHVRLGNPYFRLRKILLAAKGQEPRHGERACWFIQGWKLVIGRRYNGMLVLITAIYEL